MGQVHQIDPIPFSSIGGGSLRQLNPSHIASFKDRKDRKIRIKDLFVVLDRLSQLSMHLSLCCINNPYPTHLFI